eukprot:6181965-Pleurochrysis_carterae.AAC.1
MATASADDLAYVAASVDSFYLLVVGCFVFFMQSGFALLEAGSVRAKNTKNILLKNLLDACIGAFIWWAWGFGVARLLSEWPNVSEAHPLLSLCVCSTTAGLTLMVLSVRPTPARIRAATPSSLPGGLEKMSILPATISRSGGSSTALLLPPPPSCPAPSLSARSSVPTSSTPASSLAGSTLSLCTGEPTIPALLLTPHTPHLCFSPAVLSSRLPLLCAYSHLLLRETEVPISPRTPFGLLQGLGDWRLALHLHHCRGRRRARRLH